jgi:TolA-binding protein
MRRLGYALVASLAGAARAAPARPGVGYSDAERKEIRELEEDLRRFERSAQDFRGTVADVVGRARARVRAEIADKYAQEIQDEEREERARRQEAIALYEEFLRRHPDDPRWTPDVMYRLAELFFERSNDDYLRAAAAYDAEMGRFERHETEVVPSQPQQNYDASIQLYMGLIRQFPDYRLLDGALYLLGYCLGEQGMEATARRALLALVCANRNQPPTTLEEPAEQPRLPLAARGAGPFVDPYQSCVARDPKGRLNSEAWTRIGEYHFDYNELDLAIAAYRRVLDDPEGPYYDKALYKLAWSYYRADRFALATRGFDDLVQFADRRQQATGKFGSELRAEAIQYLAVCFAEEDWDGDGAPDTETGIERIEKFYKGKTDPYQAEVYQRLGDVYFDSARYGEARAAYKLALSRWPMRSEGPEIQERVVTTLERERRFDEAVHEREEFTRLFGAGTDWERHNRDHPEAIARARAIDEQALLQAAVFHHGGAQDLKRQCVGMGEAQKCDLAAKEYALAAAAYAKYLERFPGSRNAYELSYYLAESLYYSSQFEQAADAYARVRDSNVDNRFQEDSAYNAVKAREEQIAAAVKQKTLPDPAVPKQDAVKGPVTAQQLPEPYRRLQADCDAYVRLYPTSDKSPALAYKAAEIPYRFLRFEEARPRMAAVTERYCKNDVAVEAFTAIIASWAIDDKPAEAGRWGGKMAQAKCGTGARASEAVAKGREIETSAAFAQAKQLFDAGRFEEAAEMYVRLVDANPKHKDAPAALNNAAVAYENVQRFESATHLYERVWREYPESEFADYALFRAAVNDQRFFEFDQAVTNYLILVDNPKYGKSKYRTDALWNAAQLLDSDQAYGRAAELFRKYADLVGKEDEAAEAYFRAAKAYEKSKNLEAMTTAFLDFQHRYGDRPNQAARVVEAMFKMGRAYEQQGQRKIAQTLYEQAVTEFATRRLAPASDAAEYAANAAFLLTEAQFEEFQKMKIAGEVTRLDRQAERMAARAKDLSRLYEAIWNYRRVNWTLAAMAREGAIYEVFARAYAEGFRTAPMPADLRRLIRGVRPDEREDLLGQYQTKVDEALSAAVTPLEQQSQKLYEACLQRAAEFGVANEWSRLARTRLNAYQPEKYPLLKEEKVDLAVE